RGAAHTPLLYSLSLHDALPISPVGAFFGMGWNEFAPMNSLAMTVNPGSAFNSYWKMPFRKKCRITVENMSTDPMNLYYQVNYTLDRKSTRLNSSHVKISYAVFC